MTHTQPTPPHLSAPPEALAPGESTNAQALVPNTPPAKHHPTAGKRIHWGLTYLGGDWLLNSTFGVGFAYFASHTQFGREKYYKNVVNFFESVAKPFIKNEKTLKNVVGGGTSFLNIMFGGTVINPILTYLEKPEKKKSISKYFDTLIYGKEKVESDPYFAEAYKEIDTSPKKDSNGAWLARGIALIPLIAAASNPAVNNFFKSTKLPVLSIISHDNISRFTRNTAEWLGIRPKKMMTTMGINSITNKPSTNWEALHDYIGFDFGYTVYYALLHSAAFSAVAGLFQKRRDHREEKRAAQQAAHPPAQKAATSTAEPQTEQAAPSAEKPAETPETTVSASTAHQLGTAIDTPALQIA